MGFRSELIWKMLTLSASNQCVHVRLEHAEGETAWRAIRLYFDDGALVGARRLHQGQWGFASSPRTVLTWTERALTHGSELGVLDEPCAQSVRLSFPMDRLDLLAAATIITGEPEKLELTFGKGARVKTAPSTKGLVGTLGDMAKAAGGGSTLQDIRRAVGDDVSEEFFWAWLHLLGQLGLELELLENGTGAASFWAAAGTEDEDEGFARDDQRERGSAWSTND